ncbi:MAG: glucose-6-phosphate isomerase, partial [Bacteroidetes bacterium]|nr:glucose-6-phosphate isomerase [Bacteroidota bacterium]
MLNKVDPTKTTSWIKLQDHFQQIKDHHMKDLFAQDPKRFSKFSIQYNDILVDFSKNRITHETLEHLLELAEETHLKEAIESMFSGEAINETEKRAVLHVALRNKAHQPMLLDG